MMKWKRTRRRRRMLLQAAVVCVPSYWRHCLRQRAVLGLVSGLETEPGLGLCWRPEGVRLEQGKMPELEMIASTTVAVSTSPLPA